MLEGLLETALYVAELQRSREFYTSLLDLRVLASDERFCALSISEKQILLLFHASNDLNSPAPTPGGIIPGHLARGSIHIAFAVQELESWRERLSEAGIAVESTVKWPRGGESLYFRDPDRHLLELATRGIWEIY